MICHFCPKMESVKFGMRLERVFSFRLEQKPVMRYLQTNLFDTFLGVMMITAHID